MEVKSLEEVRKHCVSNGYETAECGRISGYLVAKGVKSVEEVIKFRIGTRTLQDFIDWFEGTKKFDPTEIVCGDCVHLASGRNYQVINVANDDLVVIDGDGCVKVINSNIVERYCTKEEASEVFDLLKANRLAYCYNCEALEPFHSVFEPIEAKVSALVHSCNEDELKILDNLMNLIASLEEQCVSDNVALALTSVFEDLAIAMDRDEY